MLLQAVEVLCQEMRILTLEAGMTEEQLDGVLEFCRQASNPDVRDVLQSLQELRRDQYENLLKIWERHPRDRWKQIKVLEDLEGRKLNESNVLDRRRTEVRKAWRDIIRVAKIEAAK